MASRKSTLSWTSGSDLQQVQRHHRRPLGASEPAWLVVPGAEGSLNRLGVAIDGREVELAGFAMLDCRTLKTATAERAHLGENELAGQIESDGGRFHATVDGKSLDLEPLWREGEGPSWLSSEQAPFVSTSE